MPVREPWKFGFEDFEPDSQEYKDSRVGRLLFDCLKLSPSFSCADYALHGGKQYPNYEPVDYETVIDSFNELTGKPTMWHKIQFIEWWKVSGRYLFDKVPKDYGDIVELFRTSHRSSVDTTDYMSALNHYLYGKHTDDGKPSVMVLSVPLVGSKKNILKSFSRLLDNTEVVNSEGTTSFGLFLQRFHEEGLRKKLKLLSMSAIEPRKKLINLCIDSGFSDTYPNQESYKKARENKSPEEINKIDRTIAATTSRAIYDMVYIIENAARGRFPCDDKKYLPEIDKKKVLKIIQAKIEGRYHSHQMYEGKIQFMTDPAILKGYVASIE